MPRQPLVEEGVVGSEQIHYAVVFAEDGVQELVVGNTAPEEEGKARDASSQDDVVAAEALLIEERPLCPGMLKQSLGMPAPDLGNGVV
jgi:hypothetical protein